MAVKRKGFVYTLESVIASVIVVSMILVVVPDITSDPEIDLEPVRTGIESQDQRDMLGSNPGNISESVEEFIPGDYNFSIRTTELSRTSYQVGGNRQIQLNSGYKRALVWIDDSDELEISFRGNEVLDTDETGYREINLGTQPGYLNFSGNSIDLDTEIHRYKQNGSSLSGETVYSLNYLQIKNGDPREIQVSISR